MAIAFENSIKAIIEKKLAINIRKKISFVNSSSGSVAKATITMMTETMKLLASVKFEGEMPPLIFDTRTQIPVKAKRTGVQSEIKIATNG